jgi:hypothetical protein
MSHKTAATVAHTIGIDTGKNSFHIVGQKKLNASICFPLCPQQRTSPDRPGRSVSCQEGTFGEALLYI